MPCFIYKYIPYSPENKHPFAHNAGQSPHNSGQNRHNAGKGCLFTGTYFRDYTVIHRINNKSMILYLSRQLESC
jgi:hypothetical protein